MPERIIARVKSIPPKDITFAWAKTDQLRGKDIKFSIRNQKGDFINEKIQMGTHLIFIKEDLILNSSGNYYQSDSFRLASPDELPESLSAPSREPLESTLTPTDNDNPSGLSTTAPVSQEDLFTYPFNFITPGIPLSPKSPAKGFHDRFHSDRYSGVISCKIITKSPLFIPDSEGWEKETVTIEGKTKEHWKKPFFKVNGVHSIPGSSIKGMIRSIAEAASNSCYSVFDDQRFAYRLTKNLPPPHKRRQGKIFRSGDQWKIKEMDFVRVPLGGLGGLTITYFDPMPVQFWKVELFTRGTPEAIKIVGSGMTWEANIDPTLLSGRVIARNGRNFVLDSATNIQYRIPKTYPISAGTTVNFKIRKLERTRSRTDWFVTEINGTDTDLVTGPFPGVLKWAESNPDSTKGTHQVFFEKSVPVIHDLDKKISADYVIAQKGKDHRNPKTFQDGQLVFFTIDNGGEVTSVGPVQMYKNAYRYSSRDLLIKLGHDVVKDPEAFLPCEKPEKLCTACQLFGFVPGTGSENKQAMSGRISFSTARLIAQKDAFEGIPLKILGSPKPKYYPFYLTGKKGKNDYPIIEHPKGEHSWEGQESRIRGRKFYWHHPNLINSIVPDWKVYLSQHSLKEGTQPEPKTDLNITAEVLPPGAEFIFNIKFENLTSVELGLLLFSIDFNDGGDSPLCHHLGMGKPLGMGSVKTTIKNIKLIDRQIRYQSLLSTGDYTGIKVIEKAREDFILALESSNNSPNRFLEIPNIRDLLTLSDINHPQNPSEIRYRPLNLSPDKNFLWFGGGKLTKSDVYKSPRHPLPTIFQVIDRGQRQEAGIME